MRKKLDNLVKCTHFKIEYHVFLIALYPSVSAHSNSCKYFSLCALCAPSTRLVRLCALFKKEIVVTHFLDLCVLEKCALDNCASSTRLVRTLQNKIGVIKFIDYCASSTLFVRTLNKRSNLFS